MGDEIWQDIVGYENKYKVSTFGRVKSLMYVNAYGSHPKERILKLHTNSKNGYQYVQLSKNNKVKSYRVHCLVMNTFYPMPKKVGYDKNYTINHKDGNKTNNHIDNLEWCTQSENQVHAFKLGLNPTI